MKKKFIKFVAFGDVHKEDKYLNKVIEFIKIFKPDEIIIAGDFFDFSEISKYSMHKRNTIGINECIEKTRKEIEWGIKTINKINLAKPKNCKVTFIKGNHDVRFDHFFTYEYPQMSYKVLDERIDFKGLGWNVLQEGEYYKLGKLYFMHGEKLNGDFFTKTASIKLRKNVRLWHHHTNQSYTISTPLGDHDLYECKAVGCLCSKDPSYLKGLTNRWINSFLVGYVDEKTGYFQDYIVNIIKNRIIFNDIVII